MTYTNNASQYTTRCPVCSGTGFRPWYLGLLQCESCALVLSPAIWQPQANEQLEEAWFGEDYQPATSFWVGLFEKWNNRRTLARLAQVKPPGRHLLEIGVGSGSFLNAAREQGYEVIGCDLSRPICNRARNAYGIEMHCGPLTTLAAGNYFDVIVMNHVLEHVQQPVDFLTDVVRVLAPGGVVHIAVPNVACWQASLSGWTSFEPYHLTYFAPETLRPTVTRSGLGIKKIATLDSFSGWFLALLRTALGVNRASGAVTRPSVSTGSKAAGRRSPLVENAYRIVTVLVGLALWPVRLFQAKIGRGDELICIARKPQSASNPQGSQ
jgi:2-polyprenyl-3-methyl-5-hydroxy-6-metoxy-1,4-benzoquinol methylase